MTRVCSRSHGSVFHFHEPAGWQDDWSGLDHRDHVKKAGLGFDWLTRDLRWKVTGFEGFWFGKTKALVLHRPFSCHVSST